MAPGRKGRAAEANGRMPPVVRRLALAPIFVRARGTEGLSDEFVAAPFDFEAARVVVARAARGRVRRRPRGFISIATMRECDLLTALGVGPAVEYGFEEPIHGPRPRPAHAAPRHGPPGRL